MDKAEAIAIIRSLLSASKESFTVTRLNEEFEAETGMEIPRFEYENLSGFLHSIPDTIKITGLYPIEFISLVANDKSGHIVSLVNRQKTSETKKKPTPKPRKQPMRNPPQNPRNRQRCDKKKDRTRVFEGESGEPLEQCRASTSQETPESEAPRDGKRTLLPRRGFTRCTESTENLVVSGPGEKSTATCSKDRKTLTITISSKPTFAICSKSRKSTADASTSTEDTAVDTGREVDFAIASTSKDDFAVGYTSRMVSAIASTSEEEEDEEDYITGTARKEGFTMHTTSKKAAGPSTTRRKERTIYTATKDLVIGSTKAQDWELFAESKRNWDLDTTKDEDITIYSTTKQDFAICTTTKALAEYEVMGTARHRAPVLENRKMKDWENYSRRREEYQASSKKDPESGSSKKKKKNSAKGSAKKKNPVTEPSKKKKNSVICSLTKTEGSICAEFRKDGERKATTKTENLEDFILDGQSIPVIDVHGNAKIGDYIEVCPCKIISPHQFYFHLRKYKMKFTNLVFWMQMYYCSERGIPKFPQNAVKPGQACAVRYRKIYADFMFWYRGEIKGKGMGSQVLVTLIDYGKTVEVLLKNVRYLRREFAEIPKQALLGSLANIRPPKNRQFWPRKATRKFFEYSIEKDLVAGVVSIDEEESRVNMALTNTRGMELHINDTLVEEGLAEFTPNVGRGRPTETVSDPTVTGVEVHRADAPSGTPHSDPPRDNQLGECSKWEGVKWEGGRGERRRRWEARLGESTSWEGIKWEGPRGETTDWEGARGEESTLWESARGAEATIWEGARGETPFSEEETDSNTEGASAESSNRQRQRTESSNRQGEPGENRDEDGARAEDNENVAPIFLSDYEHSNKRK